MEILNILRSIPKRTLLYLFAGIVSVSIVISFFNEAPPVEVEYTATLTNAGIDNQPTEPLLDAFPPFDQQSNQTSEVQINSGQNSEFEAAVDRFRDLLATGDYETAVYAYDRIYTHSSTELSAVYRELILDHASDLIQQSNSTLAAALLDRYVSIFLTDVEALTMLGLAHKEAGAKLKAIQSLQQAYQYEHRISRSELILNQTNTILGEYVQSLKDADDRQAVVDVYRWLTDSQPSVSGYFIGLARAYVAQQRFSEAAQALHYVKNDIKVGRQARSLLQELATDNNI